MRAMSCWLVVLGIFLAGWVTPAEAHVLESDGSIGAVLHVDPEDDPIVGQPSNFFFEFKDKQNQFQPSNCDCVAVISRDGQELLSQPLLASGQTPSLTSSSFSYIFPSQGVYTVKVSGKPYEGESFQPFTLTYDLRVDRTSGGQPSDTGRSWLSYAIFGGGILLFLAFILYDRKASHRSTPQS